MSRFVIFPQRHTLIINASIPDIPITDIEFSLSIFLKNSHLKMPYHPYCLGYVDNRTRINGLFIYLQNSFSLQIIPVALNDLSCRSCSQRIVFIPCVCRRILRYASQ